MKIQFGAILKDRFGKDMAEIDATAQPPAVTKITLAAVSFAALDPNLGSGEVVHAVAQIIGPQVR